MAEVSGVPLTAIRRCEQKGEIPLDRYVTLATTLKAVIQIHGPSARQPVILTGCSRPNLLPFKSIEDVIANGKAKAGPSRQIRKPQLGGMFSNLVSSRPE